MKRQAVLGPCLGILLATLAACRGAETFHPGLGAGSGGTPFPMTGTGGLGGSDEDAGIDEVGGESGSDGEDAGDDVSSGTPDGQAGANGQDTASDGATGSDLRDAPDDGETGGSSGGDAPADLTAPACTSTADCRCEFHAGHAYKFCGAGKSFVAAQADCVAQGMRLIRVNDDAENVWAYGMKLAKGFPSTWIGASDVATEGDWRWTDNTPFWTGRGGVMGSGPVNMLFNAWQTNAGEPNQNGDEDCAGYWYMNDRWADLTCTDNNAYICELY